MKVNYENTEPSTRVTPGEYDVIVCAFDVKTSKNGNPMTTLDYEIRKDVNQDCTGLKIRYDNFMFTESGAWRISALAKATAIPDGFEFEDAEHFGRVMMHRTFRATVNERDWNGKKYPEVTRFSVSLNPVAQPSLPQKPDKNGFVVPDQLPEDLPFN